MNRNGTVTSTSAIDTMAADWVIRQDAGLTKSEAVQLEEWLEADPRHAAAMAKFDQTWARLERPRSGGRAREMVLALSAHAKRRRRRVVASAGVLAVILGTFLVSSRWPSGPVADAAVASHGGIVRQPRIERLADGSVVELRHGAEISVDFYGPLRRVSLRNGEAMFQVTKNKDRPFVVTASGVDIRAVGTAFVVGVEHNTVDVIVTEGSVAVGQPPADILRSAAATDPGVVPPRSSTLVDAGKRLTVALEPGAGSAIPVTISAEEIATRLGWRETRIEFSRTPLADAVEQMNRRAKVRMVIDDPELSRLQVTGLFRADNTETLVRLLEANFGVRSERNGDTITLRRSGRGEP